MKSTESLDDAVKSADLSLTSVETAFHGDPSEKENKRRRLVRGAVAFAPLVLTLRSGALAAASCTGARLVTINDNNRINPNAAQRLGLTTEDVCFPDATVCQGYPTGNFIPTKVDSVATTGLKLTENNNGSFNCGTSNLRNMQVAILSSSSASSLGFRP